MLLVALVLDLSIPFKCFKKYQSDSLNIGNQKRKIFLRAKLKNNIWMARFRSLDNLVNGNKNS